MAGKSQVATRKIRLHENLDVIRKWWWEEGGLLEGWVVPAEPDMIAGVNTETRDVLLKVAQFDSWICLMTDSVVPKLLHSTIH